MGVSRYFAVGTRPPRNSSSLAILLSKSIHRIVMERNEDGTWGGPDSLDQFICTNHVVMTLMAAGLQPTSELLKPALEYLADLNTKRLTTFFWRSGPLLNVAQYENIVNHDIEYLFSKKERAGGNPDYPALFFLLKLLRFKEGGGRV
ncbi:hypothetical protein [uncultured Cohaesibacter sp.]|uniref:hypothetical protein n=1 Tax=uncultured Cohaesibacter sp. TaxID=1002546 RepID=UPI00292DAD8C|nr:hypothetical protein [uncultured Cohaesibacter sp.]